MTNCSADSLAGFFQGKRVLITGHTGFKGSWLGLILSKMGAVVCGLSLPALPDSLYPRLTSVYQWESIICDINDLPKLGRAVAELKPEIVFHLAAQSFIPAGRAETLQTLRTNVIGLANLLEAVDAAPSVRAVVVVTSDKCYQNSGQLSEYDEASPLGCEELYSASKASAELVARGYYSSILKQKGVRLATARASNVLGGGDFNTDRLIPYLIDCFASGRKAAIRNPGFIRPWQNVLDVLHGYLLLAKALCSDDAEQFCAPFNFGPDDSGFATVETLARLLLLHFEGADYEIVSGGSKVETPVLRLSSRKAADLLGWHPRFTLSDTVSMTADFHKRLHGGDSAETVCDFYIDQYWKEVM